MGNFIKNPVIKKAFRSAKNSNVSRGKVGAVLFTDNGNIITHSCNTTFFGHNNKLIFTIHAERYLLSKAFKIKALHRFRGRGLNVLVVRYSKSINHPVNARPCNECEFYLKEAGLRIFYTDNNGEVQELK